MGFTPREAVITVDFTGTALAGLLVKIKDSDTDSLLALMRKANPLGAKGGKGQGGEDAEGVADAMEDLLSMVADLIVEWDLEVPAGNPLPPTREVLGKQSFTQFTGPLVNMCINALHDVGDDLGKGSASGQPSPVALLPMAPL